MKKRLISFLSIVVDAQTSPSTAAADSILRQCLLEHIEVAVLQHTESSEAKHGLTLAATDTTPMHQHESFTGGYSCMPADVGI